MQFAMTRFQRGALFIMSLTAAVTASVHCGSPAAQPVTTVTVSPAAMGLDTPLDATPDPMGTEIYFIAKSPAGPGVFHVPAAGGKVTTLFSGAPLVAPRGISTSSDGKTLYIADPASGADGKGAIYTMPSSGDTPMPLAPTVGTRPTALTIASSQGDDDLYFTGEDASQVPAVFKLVANATMLTTLASGAPLAKPDGITVATDGTVYVADAQAGMTQPGQLFKVANGKATALGPELKPGSPTGVAVTLDGSQVWVSSLDPASGTSQVTIVATKDGSASTYNKTINANTVSGGLHRALFQNIFAWAGKTQVYSISIKIAPLTSSTPGGVADRSL